MFFYKGSLDKVHKTWTEVIGNKHNEKAGLEKDSVNKIIQETMIKQQRNERSREIIYENLINHRVAESIEETPNDRKKRRH